jgi:hypothetical protein
MNHLIFILVSIVCFASTAFPCSMVGGLERPLRGPNVRAYIFIGEVIGYTEIIKSRVKPNSLGTEDKFYGEGRGLKIKPVEAINLPKAAGDYFEFYKFGVTPFCADSLTDLSNIKIGTKFRIVAYEAVLLPEKSGSGPIRLQSKIFDPFSIVKDAEFESRGSLEFDYKKNWKRLRDKFKAEKDYEKTSAFYDFIYLETNKDLLRLENSSSKKIRYKILERLLYNPLVDYPGLISPAFEQNSFASERLLILLSGPVNPVKPKQIKLTSTEKELLKRRKELETSGYFK